MRTRVDRMRRAPSPAAFDVSVPVVVIKVGRYPIHVGGVGAIRSLGRVGIPVYAMVEGRFAPAATSRYLAGRLHVSLNATDSIEELLAGLVDVGRRIGRPAIALPTDDEAAVLVAQHAEELSPWFITPNVEPALPARLASKHGLRDLCIEHGLPPRSRRRARRSRSSGIAPRSP
jgi:D-aspartate ligase